MNAEVLIKKKKKGLDFPILLKGTVFQFWTLFIFTFEQCNTHTCTMIIIHIKTMPMVDMKFED